MLSFVKKTNFIHAKRTRYANSPECVRKSTGPMKAKLSCVGKGSRGGCLFILTAVHYDATAVGGKMTTRNESE